MEKIQSIINTVVSSMYLLTACGIGLFLLVLVFTLNFRKIIHAMVSSVIVIAPYEEGKKLIRHKQSEDEFSYMPVKPKSKHTHLCSNCSSPHKTS